MPVEIIAEMAAEQILQGLSEDFLQCSICMSRLQNPLMLPCLHSFCCSCLEKWTTAAQKQPLSCPTCRRPVQLPTTGVEGLPSNFLLTSLMERLDLVGKLSTEKSSNCDFCRNRTSANFCIDCQLHICLTCQIGHSRLPGASEHVMIAADKVSDVNYLKDMTSKKPPRCTHHPQEKLRFDCTTCSKLVCRDCTVLNHQGHKCCEAEQEVTTARNSLERHLKENQVLAQNAQKCCEKLTSLAKLIETHTTTLLKQVDDQYTKYVKKLEIQKHALYQELLSVRDEENVKLTETLSLTTCWLKATENTQKVTKQILEGNNQWQILGNTIDLIGSFQTLKQEQATIERQSRAREADTSVVTQMKFFPTKFLCSNSKYVEKDDSMLLGAFFENAKSPQNFDHWARRSFYD